MCILLLVGQRQKLNPRMLLFCAFFAADVAAAAVVRMAVSESERFIHAVQVQFTVLRIQMLSLWRSRPLSILQGTLRFVSHGCGYICRCRRRCLLFFFSFPLM